MDLNNLIQKIINIDIEENKENYSICFFILSIFLFFTTPILFSLFYYSFKDSIEIGLFTYILCFLVFFIFDNFYIYNNKSKISDFIFKKHTKKLKLTEEEKNIINEYTFSPIFMISVNSHNFLLDYLIEKNISKINYNNLEEFLNILKNNNLHKKYLNTICNKITTNKNLIHICYPITSNFNNIQLSEEEKIFEKFLNKNQQIKPLIIEKLYINCSLENIQKNKNFLNELSTKQITDKILEKYTLKEFTHSLFSNSNFNNIFHITEISDILKLLNDENTILIKKYFINKVLSENDSQLIEHCYLEFFNITNNINIENKQELYLLKSKFPEEQLITNDNLKIIHI